jgi:hypothetical protein
VLYLRFDGLEPHRKAYDQTAFAEVMRGDLGVMVDQIIKTVVDFAVKELRPESPAATGFPDVIRKGLQTFQGEVIVNRVKEFLDYFRREGFVLGLEIIELEPPRVQLTLVFPNGGEKKNREALLGGFRLITLFSGVAVKENERGGRTFYTIEDTGPVRIAWWQEGEHLLLTAGTETPEHTLSLLPGSPQKRSNLTESALHRSVAEFKGYETMLRAFVDFERGVKLAQTRGKEVNQIIDGLGLDGLRSVIVHSGCAGRLDRGTVLLRTAGERKGILRLLSASDPIDPNRLPPMPPDATSITAMSLDLNTLYEVALQTLEVIVKTIDPAEWPKIEAAIKQANQVAGIDIRKDLLASLGSTVVTYSSPSEGPFSIGNGVAIQVKDVDRLQRSLETLIKSLAAFTGAPISLKKQKYHGVELCTLQVSTQGFPLVPSYTIHQGWFVLAMFPQPVQGFILRSTGKYSVWKPTPLAEEAVNAARKNPRAKVAAVRVVDPRPTVKLVLSVAPLLGSLFNGFAPGVFDVATIPNAQAVAEPLFPNVTLTLDDGETFAIETYASLSLPFDLSSLDTYALALLGFGFFAFRIAGL